MLHPTVPRRILITGGSGFVGTNLIQTLRQGGDGVLNVSRTKPRNTDHLQHFRQGNVLDLDVLTRTFQEFSPEIVVHLAAETGYGQKQNRSAYEVNTTGTARVIEAVSICSTVRLAVFASSNVVERDSPGNDGASGHFLYSDSKRAAEDLIQRNTTMRCTWCIVRPCYVWGPWFDAPFKDFFLSVARGLYVRSGTRHTRRRVGYVGNVVHQLCALMAADEEQLHRKTFYLADYDPITIEGWAEMISDELGVHHPWAVPDVLITYAGRFGDALHAMGFEKFPLTSIRVSHMRYEAFDIPIESTRAIAGPLPFTVQQGIRITVDWMRTEGLLRPHD